MRSPRIYHNASALPSTKVSLTERARHHLVNVLRCKVDQTVILFNGYEESEAHGTIVEISKKTCVVKLDRVVSTQRESPLKLTLVQAVSASDKMDFTLQKAVELGISDVQPIFTERSQRPFKHTQLEKKLKHWNGVIVHACEQSGRCLLPTLHPPLSLDGQLKTGVKAETRLLLSPTASDSLQQIKAGKSAAVYVGPEGGFTDAEVKKLVDSGVAPIRLGSRILRTETAGIAVISWLQIQFGDLT